MDQQLRQLYQQKAAHKETLGILYIPKRDSLSSNTDGYNAVLLVVLSESYQASVQLKINHYVYEGNKVQLIEVVETKLRKWIETSNPRRVIDWIINGKIVYERNEFFDKLKKEMQSFPIDLRKKKMIVEYGRLNRRYLEGKELHKDGEYLDAFNQMLHALHHWARLVVIEHGIHPEITLWRQVKAIEPEVYKLYDELINGKEALSKRIELLLLASEFSLGSKTRIATMHLQDILMQRNEPWTYDELLQQNDVQEYATDLSIILEQMFRKNIIKELEIDHLPKIQLMKYEIISEE